MTKNHINVLEDPVIHVDLLPSGRTAMTLPQIYAALAANRIKDYSALRPHQAPAWHAFLVQIAVMALEAADHLHEQPGDDQDLWAIVLRALTPQWPDDAPWCLISSPAKPALLQAPVPTNEIDKYDKVFKKKVTSPDALDMLSTAKNHDLKSTRINATSIEHWIYALMSLQTQEGVMGRGNYGIARMNSGYGNRIYVGVRPHDATPGIWFKRDVETLLSKKARTRLNDEADAIGLGTEEAQALLWTTPWDGRESMPITRVHPLVVEICRRVRLTNHAGNIEAHVANSEVTRLNAQHLKGNFADPWTPVERADPAKALSTTREGFSYRRMSELLFGSEGRSWRLPILADLHDTPQHQGADLYAIGIARGQGKTEGFHQRVITIPSKVTGFLQSSDSQLPARSRERIRQASAVQGKCLRAALIVLMQKGPADPDWRKPSNDSLVTPWTIRFDKMVDQIFFHDLWGSIDDDEENAERTWSERIAGIAREILRSANESAPRTDDRRIIADVRAANILNAALRKHLPALNHKSQDSRR